MEEQLIDYLYGELDADQRAAFERALPAHPEVAAELERHRWTRARMAELPVVPLPAGALDEAMLAAERHIQSVAKVAPRPGFFARLGKLFLQPAFATAFVAVLGVGIGLFMSRSRELPGVGPSPDDQLGASLPHASETAVPAVRVPEHARLTKNEEKVAEAEREADRPAPPAQPDPSPAMVIPAAEPVAAQGAGEGGAAGTARPRTAAVGGAVQPGFAGPSSGGPTAKPVKEQPGKPTETPRDGDELEAVWGAEDTVTTLDTLKDAPVVTGLVEESGARGGATAASGDMAATAASGDMAADESAGRAKTTTGTSSTTNTEARSPTSPPPSAPRTDSEAREVQVLAAERGESKKVSIDDETPKAKGNEPRLATEKAPTSTPSPEDRKSAAPAPTAPTPDPTKTPDRSADKADTKAPAPSEEKLWANYQAQLAAGAFADANKTLADLLKLTGDNAKLKAAREALAKREAEAKRAEQSKVPADKLPPDPAGPAPGKAP
ncbi:MAG: hypothetical protein IT385_17270 [Deltaproteobacteria bacterium]|nr:hypothetical protein [Deltaproteobacteria bacterium]